MSELRNLPTQQRSRDTLDRLIAAADELFAERGVGDATNSMIAEKAGVSIGTLYRFFPNKSALVAEYLDRYLADLARGLPSELPASPTLDDLEEIVTQLLDRSVQSRLRFRGYGRVRLWTYPETGVAAQATIHTAELALMRSLIETSPYKLASDQIDRMCRVIVDAPWPVIEGMLDLPKKQRELMQLEVVRLIVSYVREVIEPR